MSKHTDKYFVKEIKRLQKREKDLMTVVTNMEYSLNRWKELGRERLDEVHFLINLFERKTTSSVHDERGFFNYYNSKSVYDSDKKFEELDRIFEQYRDGVKSWEEQEQEVKG